MKPFHSIAVPHADILEDRLSLDTFTADLWDVFKGRGAAVYADRAQFFHNTYQTETLQTLLTAVANRLHGDGGEPVLRVQTPFGSGKTHALIALYHHAAIWQVKTVVIVGTAMSATETIWGAMEKQLTGAQTFFVKNAAPGREKLHKFFAAQPPVLILIDELLEYITKAAAIPVGESSLAAQTIAFFQELSEVISDYQQIALVLTLPSGLHERFDQQSAWFFGQIQKVIGRMEKIYTPVQEHELPYILRQRLFAQVDPAGVQAFLDEFLPDAERESLFPAGVSAAVYRQRFEASYPFLPDLLTVLSQRWGSYPGFQGTRGMLRVLALLLATCKSQPRPYLSLADVNFAELTLRREFLGHIGAKFDQVLMQEIVGEHASVKPIDLFAQDLFHLEQLGTRTATTIFLYSFAEEAERGATSGEIKRQVFQQNLSGPMLNEVLEQLKTALFYLHTEEGRYYFTGQPNLNQFLLKKIEQIDNDVAAELERGFLKKATVGDVFQIYPLIHQNRDIPDDQHLKLVILKHRDDALMRQILRMHGDFPRINPNTIIFLTAGVAQEHADKLPELLKQYLAWGMLLAEASQKFTEEQRKEVKMRWKNIEFELLNAIKRHYRLLIVPQAQGWHVCDLDMPGLERSLKMLDDRVYDYLKANGFLLEHLTPAQIVAHCLHERPYIFTEQLFRRSTTVLGEYRVLSRNVCQEAICEGVKQGLFGLGIRQKGELWCLFFKQAGALVDFAPDEVLIRSDLCVMPSSAPPPFLPAEQAEAQPAAELAASTEFPPASSTSQTTRKTVHLRLTIPAGATNSITHLADVLKYHFETLTVEFWAEGGEMTAADYENHIKQPLAEFGLDLEE